MRGASCNASGTTPATCVASPKLAEGDVCYDPSKPSSGGFGTCNTGLTCKIEGATAPAKCAKRGAAGAACTSPNDCVTELACLAGKCSTRLADGAACQSTGDCATGACPKDTKKCVPYQYGAPGAACNYDEKKCAKGSCSQASGTADGKCVDPIPDGSPCTTTSGSGNGGPRCDEYAKCINGTCQLLDPSTCK